MSKATLFDIPQKTTDGKPVTSWSPNVWETRMALNYKNLPYKTQWLEYREMEPVLSTKRITPTPTKYTVPAIQLADGSAFMDTANIAPVLENEVPQPSLRLDTDLHKKVMPFVAQIMGPLMFLVFAQVGRDIIPEHEREEWVKGKEAQFGKPLVVPEKSAADETWEKAKPGFNALGEFMKSNKKDEGPFLLGSQVCYGDFILAGIVESTKRIGGGLYEKFVGMEPQLKDLHAACKPWTENDQ
jgi:glutathione S-transferase